MLRGGKAHLAIRISLMRWEMRVREVRKLASGSMAASPCWVEKWMSSAQWKEGVSELVHRPYLMDVCKYVENEGTGKGGVSSLRG